MICENCHCEHDGNYGSGRFCSEHCRSVYCGKKVKIHRCNFLVNIEKRRSPHGTWKCKLCGEIFETRRKLQQHRKCLHGHNARFIWNKGLTKETSESVRRYSEKNKLSMSGKPHKHTKETKEKLSIIRSNQIDSENSGGFRNVLWYKVKNIDGIEFTVRGKWELTIAELLNEHNILWVRNKFIKYVDDGVKRTYNPDFYLVKENEYIEVKGYYSERDKRKMKLVVEQNKDIRIYLICEPEYNQIKERRMWLNEQMLLKHQNDVDIQ